MSKTLIIRYTPRTGSYTKQLVDEFVSLAQNKTELFELDLASDAPELLQSNNLNVILKWSHGERGFTTEEQAYIDNHSLYIQQLLEADHIVIAFPIYNFTLPAAVKAWIDAIVVNDKTFTFSPEQGFKGLCTNKRAISIVVAGFEYTPTTGLKEFATSTIQQNFNFLGIETEHITAFGVDQFRDNLDTILNTAKDKLKTTVENWYS